MGLSPQLRLVSQFKNCLSKSCIVNSEFSIDFKILYPVVSLFGFFSNCRIAFPGLGGLYQVAWHRPQNCCLTLVVKHYDCKIVVGVNSFISTNVPSLNPMSYIGNCRICGCRKVTGIEAGYCALYMVSGTGFAGNSMLGLGK
jgi:hypothetical protein